MTSLSVFDRLQAHVLRSFTSHDNALPIGRICALMRTDAQSSVFKACQLLVESGKLVINHNDTWSLAPIQLPELAPPTPGTELQRTVALMSTLLVEHGLTEKGWRPAVDGSKTRSAYCDFQRKVISISKYYVSSSISKTNTLNDVRDLCLGEIAFVLAARGAYDAEWKKLAMSIGSSGRVRISKFTEGKFKAKCGCGYINRTYHRRPMGVCSQCKGQLTVCLNTLSS